MDSLIEEILHDPINLATEQELREQLSQCIVAFEKSDRDGNKMLTIDEISNVCEYMGAPMDDDEEEQLRKMDKDGSGTIDEDEWCRWWLKRISQRPNPEKQQQVIARHTFSSYDIDGSGTIDATEFKSLIEKLGATFNDDEINEALNQLDSDGNGKVDQNEFVQWWMNRSKDARKCGIVAIKLKKLAAQAAQIFHTDIHTAVWKGQEDLVKAFLSGDDGKRTALEADMEDHGDQFTPLHYAAYQGHSNIVDMLLAAIGSKGIDKRTASGFTSLFYAAQQGHVNIVEKLLQHGADPAAAGEVVDSDPATGDPIKTGRMLCAVDHCKDTPTLTDIFKAHSRCELPKKIESDKVHISLSRTGILTITHPRAKNLSILPINAWRIQVSLADSDDTLEFNIPAKKEALLNERFEHILEDVDRSRWIKVHKKKIFAHLDAMLSDPVAFGELLLRKYKEMEAVRNEAETAATALANEKPGPRREREIENMFKQVVQQGHEIDDLAGASPAALAGAVSIMGDVLQQLLLSTDKAREKLRIMLEEKAAGSDNRKGIVEKAIMEFDIAMNKIALITDPKMLERIALDKNPSQMLQRVACQVLELRPIQAAWTKDLTSDWKGARKLFSNNSGSDLLEALTSFVREGITDRKMEALKKHQGARGTPDANGLLVLRQAHPAAGYLADWLHHLSVYHGLISQSKKMQRDTREAIRVAQESVQLLQEQVQACERDIKILQTYLPDDYLPPPMPVKKNQGDFDGTTTIAEGNEADSKAGDGTNTFTSEKGDINSALAESKDSKLEVGEVKLTSTNGEVLNGSPVYPRGNAAKALNATAPAALEDAQSKLSPTNSLTLNGVEEEGDNRADYKTDHKTDSEVMMRADSKLSLNDSVGLLNDTGSRDLSKEAQGKQVPSSMASASGGVTGDRSIANASVMSRTSAASAATGFSGGGGRRKAAKARSGAKEDAPDLSQTKWITTQVEPMVEYIRIAAVNAMGAAEFCEKIENIEFIDAQEK